jgi:MraZ protein
LADFFGTYEFTLDDRGRVSVPAQFRHQFENNQGFVTLSDDGCVELYTTEAFKKMHDDIAGKPRTTEEGRLLRRAFYGDTFPVELDRQGRVLIPQSLREEAELEGPVTIVGTGECFEIWNRERYREWRAKRKAKRRERSSGDQEQG